MGRNWAGSLLVTCRRVHKCYNVFNSRILNFVMWARRVGVEIWPYLSYSFYLAAFVAFSTRTNFFVKWKVRTRAPIEFPVP